jgi:hypothetical protein
MSERERWIVYPLLFLALGAALRDKLFDRTTSKSIVCEELTVVDAQPVGKAPHIVARIGQADPHAGAASSGHLFVNGQVEVQGVVNARHYSYQGLPIVPALPALPLGVTWADIFRAIQAAQAQQQKLQQQQQGTQPPPQQAAPQEQDSQPAPLADPAKNR